MAVGAFIGRCMNDNNITGVVVVGGGTAGWLTAGLLAAELGGEDHGIEVTLVESPEVSTIGVGEGTWPSMRSTLRKIGIRETDLIRQCSAAFKQGSKFVGWRSAEAGEFYYHPFTLPEGHVDGTFLPSWLQATSKPAFHDAVSTQGVLCDHGRAPKQITTPEYAGVANYGYHLDAGLFVELLQRHCVAKLGVKHVLDHVTSVTSSETGDIAAIETAHSGSIKGDLFIDCSGMSALLIGQHFGIKLVDKKQFLFNDTAIAMQVPYADEGDEIASATVSSAQSCGWIWDIGLSSRRGVGLVYSSAHCELDEAESILRSYVAKSVGETQAQALTSRRLPIRAGHREKFWHKNCVAIGMSAGFIEPLEASALALVELSAAMIAREMPANRVQMDVVAKRFNERFNYRWQRVVDFLKLHYCLTQRTDSDYWRDVVRPETMPDSLSELMSLWTHRPPYYGDFDSSEEVFPSASYQYVLYGMGFRPDIRKTIDGAIRRNEERATVSLQNKARQLVAALPSNRELIQHIHKHGLLKV